MIKFKIFLEDDTAIIENKINDFFSQLDNANILSMNTAVESDFLVVTVLYEYWEDDDD